MKALVVDDSHAVRRILADALQDVGFEVEQAADGKEALAHLATHPDVQLMLVDWNMPALDGIEVVEAIRRDERFASLRVMMITMERGIAHIRRAMRAGVNGYLMKPCTKEDLLDKVRSLGFQV